MELSNQVCSLELAIRLKELGVKQDAYWKYTLDSNGKTYSLYANRRMYEDEYSAFTASELLDMMNVYIELIKMNKNDYGVKFFDDNINDWSCYIRDANPPNAFAKMLIHLLENGIVKNENI